MHIIDRYLFRLFALLMTTALTVMPIAVGAEPDVIRIGISSFTETNPNRPIIQKTLAELESKLGSDRLSVRYLTLDELARAVKADALDVVLSSAGFYRRHLDLGMRDLATLAAPPNFNPNYAESSVFIVRADRSDLYTLADLKGRSISANMPTSFSGFQIAMGEIALMGEDYEKYFSAFVYSGHRMAGVIESVLSGETDAGVLRTCFLEEYAHSHPEFEIGSIKVLNEKAAVPCRRSTKLFPNWTFSTTKAAHPKESRELLSIILSMPFRNDELGWAVATDFTSVDKLMKDLRIGPYEFLRTWSLEEFMRRHAELIVALVLILITLFGHGYLVEKKVAKRTQELRTLLQKQKALQAETDAMSQRLYVLQRAGIVGQLSSLFVHELVQPIAAIKCYAVGLLRGLERGRKPQSEALAENLSDIRDEVCRVEAIVNRVRSYAKGKAAEKRAVELGDIVEKAASMTRHYWKSDAALKFERPESLMIEGDPVELELAVINLLKNAFEAVKNDPKGTVTVKLIPDHISAEVSLTVTDNGPPVPDDVLTRICAPLMTTKVDGLGLGLVLVRAIADSHGGRFVIERTDSGSLSCSLIFPLLEGSES